MENGKSFPYVSETIEKDVWFYSKKFGLNRLQFRIIMSNPDVADRIHRLNYENASASDLFNIIQENKEVIAKRAYRTCIKQLSQTIESESISDFYTES